MHLSEQPAENLACEGFYGCSPPSCSREGLLTPTTTVVHATHLSDADVELLAAARTTACFCPTTERDLADGIGPAAACTTRGCPSRSAPTSTPSSTRSRRLRGVEMHERLDSLERGRFSAADLLAMAHASTATARSAGTTAG